MLILELAVIIRTNGRTGIVGRNYMDERTQPRISQITHIPQATNRGLSFVLYSRQQAIRPPKAPENRDYALASPASQLLRWCVHDCSSVKYQRDSGVSSSRMDYSPVTVQWTAMVQRSDVSDDDGVTVALPWILT